MDFFETDIIQDSEFVDEFVKKIKKEREEGIQPKSDIFAVMPTETLPHREGQDVIIVTKPDKESLDKKIREVRVFEESLSSDRRVRERIGGVPEWLPKKYIDRRYR